MGYIGSKARCRCDFCGQIAEIDLDDEVAAVDHAKRLCEIITEHKGDKGAFFQRGDVYACDDCVSQAREAAPSDAPTPRQLYRWLDKHS